MTNETAVHGVLTGITLWGENLATWGLLVTFIMALAAIATAISAKSQTKVALQGLDLSKAGLIFAADQHIAQVLVILHARWHSLELRDSRDKVYKLLEEAQQDIIKRNPDMGPVEITQQAGQYCPEKLTALYQSNIDEYRLMMRVVGFFELAGYLVDAGYIPEKDIIELLGGAILTIGTVFEHHILEIQGRPTSSGKDFEHALALIKAVQKKEAEIRPR